MWLVFSDVWNAVVEELRRWVAGACWWKADLAGGRWERGGAGAAQMRPRDWPARSRLQRALRAQAPCPARLGAHPCPRDPAPTTRSATTCCGVCLPANTFPPAMQRGPGEQRGARQPGVRAPGHRPVHRDPGRHAVGAAARPRCAAWSWDPDARPGREAWPLPPAAPLPCDSPGLRCRSCPPQPLHGASLASTQPPPCLSPPTRAPRSPFMMPIFFYGGQISKALESTSLSTSQQVGARGEDVGCACVGCSCACLRMMHSVARWR